MGDRVTDTAPDAASNADASLRGTYLTLLLLLALCFAVHFIVRSESWVSGFSLDVAAEIIGILLVIFSVDRVIDAEQERQRRKLEQVALRQMYQPLCRHIALLIRLGGNNNDNPFVVDDPALANASLTLEQVFDEGYLDRVKALDLRTAVPDEEDGVIWSKYILRECAQFRETLNKTVEKYSLFVLPELVDAIEFVVNSPFLRDALQLLYATMPALRASDAALSSSPPYVSYRPDSDDAAATLEQMKLSLSGHIDVLLTLIATYNRCASSGKQIIYSSALQSALERKRYPGYQNAQYGPGNYLSRSVPQ
ncbi:MAG: hypothetical protein ACFB4J_16320 [Elainellaceae cyanobacterium]